MIDCPVCRSGDVEHVRWLTVAEVAERRNAHPHTVRAAIKAGDLPAKRVGRVFIVTVAEADAWTPARPGRPRAALGESVSPEPGVRLSENAHRHLKDLRRLAARAQNSYVGRNWPDMESMHRDGIGFGLNDREKEAAIRRYLYEFQPEFMLQVLDTVLAASLPALAPHPDPASAMQQATFNGGLPAPAHRGRVMAMNEEREVIDGIDVTGWARCGSPGCGVIEQVPSEHPHALPADPSGADR
jgi:excisionase family DNA binding protein